MTPLTSRPTDHPDLDLLLVLHLTGGLAVLTFGAVFWWMGHTVAGAIEALFVACLVGTGAWLLRSRRGVQAVAAFHIVVVFLDIAGVSWSLGGLTASGGFMVWGIISPLAAMMFLPRPAIIATSGAYLVLLALSWLVQPTGALVQPLDPALQPLFTAANLVGGAALALLTLGYFHGKLRAEQRRADDLLLNMLPARIAETLKREPGTIAEHHDGASILFADLVGFTPMCRELSPTQVVDVLNEVFSRFDALAARFGVEKIKTIGDSYMAAAGVPDDNPRHAVLLAAMGLEMVRAARQTTVLGRQLQVRVGVSSGPVVAGVIGQRKFIYDLWGDAVNLASRMESHGATGQVRVTAATHALIAPTFECTCLGPLPIKGVGTIEVWQVDGWREGVERVP